MSVATLESELMEVAREFHEKGPGFSQEPVVLREMRQRVKPQTLREEQEILNAWHRLFRENKLVWGYDLDNPGAPWFHVPE
jgi:hypothetical protein